MQEDYAKAMATILVYEGGKDDDPVDPGGRTNQGIIQRVYSAWRKKKGLPPQDVFLMTNDERDAIYFENYAVPCHFNEMPPGVDIVVFDGGVNSGPSQSIKWLQRALGVYADGVFGNATKSALDSYPDYDVLIAKILDRRRAFLKSLKTYYHFGKGWMARVDNLQKVGQAMATGSIGPNPVFAANGNKKATLVDAVDPPSTAPAAAMSSGGAITTGISTVQGVFQPLQGTHFIDQVLIGLAITAALVTAAGVAYGYWAKNKRAEINDALDLNPAAPAPHANDDVPQEVLAQYVDPNAKGSATGNIAPGRVTVSGRVAGDTEVRVNSAPTDKAA